MKKFLKIALLLLLPAAAMAQDSVITITPGVFNEYGQYFITKANGWLFKQGSDTIWAQKDLDIKGWQKLSPTKLSAKYADKNGRAEGWFRVKFNIGDTFTDKMLGLKSTWWATEDIYVDGRLIISYGNTGVNGKPFHESSSYGNVAIPIPIDFKPGTEHSIAVHFVDYVAPMPPLMLKSEDSNPNGMVLITREGYNAIFLSENQTEKIVEGMWIAVCTVLCLLFWLLYFQNPLEKSLRIIALCTMFFALTLMSGTFATQFGVSYLTHYIFGVGNVLFVYIATAFTLLVLVSVFVRRVTTALKIFLGMYFVAALIDIFFLNNSPIVLVTLVAVMLLNLYYVISSWKYLKGPQWAIVIGLIVSLIFAGAYFYIGSLSEDIFLISVTGYSLAFPLSLLVYVSMRFKEIITEVRVNAARVIQLSEEKEQEALNRQEVLQKEVNRQTAEIRATLDNLKATQTQLIQSEKMASLGELTAGIAHEIQNPLNFVNNFSEVNTELIDEMQQEIDKGDYKEVKALANNIKENQEKISQHGKRADFIVKGMLQHSRTSSGEKQETNINMLADEFLKLSYHGLRAKEKNFNAVITTHFDENLPRINIAAQDIGRVLLNLFNNAFYAVNDKKKVVAEDYKPEIIVSTRSTVKEIEIRVKDNGNGIPDAIKDKIMQPFFTTKPTGEGTGLGLSLSYDIVVKGHGGSINVNTEERYYTEFIITLPFI